MLHSILSKLPKPLDLEGLISRAIHLLRERPPKKLSTWRHVSRLSCLQTCHSTSGAPSLTLAEAEEIFRKQCHELERVKRRKEFMKAVVKHKKPAIMGLSLVIGLSSIAFGLYARQNSDMAEPFPISSLFWRILAAVQQMF
jgi:hypothetical protein